MEGAKLTEVEEGLKQIIEAFYQGEVIMQNYDSLVSPDALNAKFQEISGLMQNLNETVDSLESSDIPVPEGLVKHIDSGLNVEKYDSKREEDANRSLKIMQTKMATFGLFRDALQAALKENYPEESAEYERVTKENNF